MKKRGVPLVYICFRDRILKNTNWKNQISHRDARAVLGWSGIPKEVREDVLKEMMDYNLIQRINQIFIEVIGVKKKCIFW